MSSESKVGVKVGDEARHAKTDLWRVWQWDVKAAAVDLRSRPDVWAGADEVRLRVLRLRKGRERGR